jgi:transposase
MLHPKMAHVYVGIDMHRLTHTATIINCFFEKLGEVTFKNKLPDFPKLECEVKKHISDGVTPVYGLEDYVSLGRELTSHLLSTGHTVKYVNPSLTKSERNNQASLHKTDSFDSLCVARVLLSKLGELPDARTDDKLWALTELVSKRASLVRSGTAVKNQLHNYISHHYPSYKRFFYVFDCKTALAFWEMYPSPAKLKGVSLVELAKFLQAESRYYYSLDKASEIIGYIAEDGYTGNEMQDTCDFIVSLTVKQLKEISALVKVLDEKIEALVPQFGYKLHTMKGIGFTTAAALIVEIGDINRFGSAAQLAAYAGVSPAEYSSGQSEKQISNKRGNRNLNTIIYYLGISQCGDRGDKGSPFNRLLAEYYKKKI